MKIRIGTATGGGKVVDSNDPVLVIEFHARSDNGGSVYVGMSDVAENNGRELPPGESFTIDCSITDTGRSSGSVILSKFYVVASGGNKVDYTAIIRGD